VEAANNVQFGDPEVQRLTGLLDYLLNPKLKSVSIPLFPSKGAELTTENAVVRIVDITVQNITGLVACLTLSDKVGDGSDGVQVLAFEQPQGIGLRNSFVCGDLFIKVPQFAALNEKLHQIEIPEIIGGRKSGLQVFGL
jgi:hypothetical protein